MHHLSCFLYDSLIDPFFSLELESGSPNNRITSSLGMPVFTRLIKSGGDRMAATIETCTCGQHQNDGESYNFEGTLTSRCSVMRYCIH